jgi:hypothetical protein
LDKELLVAQSNELDNAGDESIAALVELAKQNWEDLPDQSEADQLAKPVHSLSAA